MGNVHWGNPEPTYCVVRAHVFECKHESTYKCGQIKRVME